MELRHLLGPKNASLKVIAKIENREGVENTEEIARAADGIMVARGDLGIEIDIAALPNVQRELVRTCARLGKRCIVATHLLESMIENPIPTRAEVTDVANAIYEGVDAVMLSGETSVGRYPVRSVEQLSKIAAASERFPGLGFARDLETDTDKHHLAVAAAGLAEAISASGIVVITRRGLMADLVTSCQPPHVPIYVFTNNSQARRRLMLNRASTPTGPRSPRNRRRPSRPPSGRCATGRAWRRKPASWSSRTSSRKPVWTPSRSARSAACRGRPRGVRSQIHPRPW